jgi:GT2 family glycosyltransferase
VYNGAMLVRRSVFDRVGVLDTTLHHCMDFELMLRISREASVRSCGEVVALLRMQPDSKSATRAWSFFLERWQVVGRYGAFRPRRLPRTLLSQAYRAGYLLTRPLWHSQIWRRVRREKSLGGGR